MGATEGQEKSSLIRFGEFTLDLRRRGLFRGQERVHLTAKPLETLIYLAENAGRIVAKQELLDAAWKDTFVTEDALVQAIREIRRALGDDKDDPRFVQTVPRQGYRFVGEIAADPIAPTPGIAPTLPVRPARNLPRWVWVAAALAVFPVLIWWLWPAGRQGASKPALRNLLPLQQLTGGEFYCGKPSFSPDGKFIVYVSSSEETRGYGDLFVRPVAEGNPQRITDRVNPSGDIPVFTADGNHVVFSLPRAGENGARAYDLWMVPASGGPLKRFIRDASGAGFSPDGRWVAYTKHLPSGNALWVSPVGDLNQYREVSAEGYTPRFSPDGQGCAYTTSNPNAGVGDIWVTRLLRSGDGQPSLAAPQQLTREGAQMYGLTWAADSRSIIFASRRAGAMQLYEVAIADASVSLLLGGVGDYGAPSAAPDGSALIFSQYRLVNDLMLAALGTPCDGQALSYDQFHRWPRISPSGEKLVSIVRQVDHGERLYLTDLKTKESARLSDRPARHPCWLDRETVAFLSEDASTQDTEALAVNTRTREVWPLARFSGKAEWLAVQHDGKRLAVVLTSPDGKQELLLRDLSNQSDTTIHRGLTYENLRWLPGGSALAWNRPGVSDDAPSGGIWVMEVGRAEPRLVAPDGYALVGSVDGSAVYYSRTRGQAGLWRLDLKQGKEQQICAWERRRSFDTVGNRLVFAQHKNNSQIYLMALR